MPNFSLCIFCARTIFASSSFRFSSLYSVRNSIISVADDFDRRFFFFFGGSRQLARGNSSSSSVDVLPVAGFAVKEETVAVGIIFGSVPKNSSSSSWKSHSFRVVTRFVVVFLDFFILIILLLLLILFILLQFLPFGGTLFARNFH